MCRGAVAHGCLFSVNKRFRLGYDIPGLSLDYPTQTDAKLLRLAGPYVVAAFRVQGSVIGGDDVRLVDLRDGTRVDPGGGVQIVRSLVLHASGAVAWIANEYYSKALDPRRVRLP
jgi:hypothetical protein